jgi:hypothetical protein
MTFWNTEYSIFNFSFSVISWFCSSRVNFLLTKYYHFQGTLTSLQDFSPDWHNGIAAWIRAVQSLLDCTCTWWCRQLPPRKSTHSLFGSASPWFPLSASKDICHASTSNQK